MGVFLARKQLSPNFYQLGSPQPPQPLSASGLLLSRGIFGLHQPPKGPQPTELNSVHNCVRNLNFVVSICCAVSPFSLGYSPTHRNLDHSTKQHLRFLGHFDKCNHNCSIHIHSCCSQLPGLRDAGCVRKETKAEMEHV